MKQLAKGLIFLLFVIIGVAGCQQKQSIPEGFYPYEKNEVEQAVEQLSFRPEIPGYVPIEMEIVVSDQYVLRDTEIEALDVSFYTRDNDLLSIQFIDGEMNEELMSPEIVSISEKINGAYIDNSYAKVLSWQKDGITYKITYRSSEYGNNPSVTKTDLVMVAKSFHS
ncbi:hypothetical protein NC661_07700 [Aquibacillus koreensis]|uniref:DUF4367 domain-containing protein n=1 Tax=Aquibacillus koreensis TaxID=279446 RepID=A0A9X3WMY4_9BACI|nr:hypothetical protein [Aquibacillus koreensis]MCT2535799.1 hypothetical protein [Aquibacillus koreensis]MDC3420254.1 hypothetical protein [Aquibacillus koreensis]